MRLLLDTHVWIWSLLEPNRLGTRVLKAIGDGKSTVWLSPISVWEAAMLIERRRLEVDGSADAWIRGALRVAPLHEAGLSHEVALRSRSMELPHQDPADRFLAATAAVYDLSLVTADARLLRGSGYRTLEVAS